MSYVVPTFKVLAVSYLNIVFVLLCDCLVIPDNIFNLPPLFHKYLGCWNVKFVNRDAWGCLWAVLLLILNSTLWSLLDFVGNFCYYLLLELLFIADKGQETWDQILHQFPRVVFKNCTVIPSKIYINHHRKSHAICFWVFIEI